MTANRMLAGLAALACGTCGPAITWAVETVTCPAVFPMSTVRFGSAKDGWTSAPGASGAALAAWGLSSGPPADLAALQPSIERGGSAIWKFEGRYPEGVWVDCVYADGALSLGKRLSLTTGECVAPKKKEPPGKPEPVTFVCR